MIVHADDMSSVRNDFGSGRILQVSIGAIHSRKTATTFVDEDNASYYKGRIVLEQDHVRNDPKWNLVLPGMTVAAHIITGEKTVLAYLSNPIHTALK